MPEQDDSAGAVDRGAHRDGYLISGLERGVSAHTSRCESDLFHARGGRCGLALAGPRGAAAISVLVILSAFGVLNGVILAGPRIYYRDGGGGPGVPLARARCIHGFRRRIWRSCCKPSGPACWWRREPTALLFTRVIYTEWIFFALMTVGLMRLRRTRRITRRPTARGAAGGAADVRRCRPSAWRRSRLRPTRGRRLRDSASSC